MAHFSPPIHPTISHLEEVHVLRRCTTYVSVVMSQHNLFPQKSTPLKINSSPLKKAGWKTIRLPFREGDFSGATYVKLRGGMMSLCVGKTRKV